MKNLKATKKFPLGRRWIKPGDTFSLEDKEADLLVKVGNAQYNTGQMKAENTSAPRAPRTPAAATNRPKRQYKRRDMKANDE
jgi:hypothetical protein